MYNESRKLSFMTQYKESSQIKLRLLFDRLEEFEEDKGKDFEYFTEAEALNAVAIIVARATSTAKTRLSQLNTYLDWCVSEGVTSVNVLKGKNVTDIDYSIVFQIDTFDSPKSLAEFMDVIFEDRADETINNMTRVFLWCLYMGIDEENILKLKDSDVNTDSMRVSSEDCHYDIPREAFTDFIVAKNMDGYIHYGTAGAHRRKFESYTTFIKGGTKTRLSTIRTRLSIAYRKWKEDPNFDGRKITLDGVKMSGIYYRLYQRECAGKAINLTPIAKETMKQDEYTIRYERVLSHKEKDELQAYEMWKKTFQL